MGSNQLFNRLYLLCLAVDLHHQNNQELPALIVRSLMRLEQCGLRPNSSYQYFHDFAHSTAALKIDLHDSKLNGGPVRKPSLA